MDSHLQPLYVERNTMSWIHVSITRYVASAMHIEEFFALVNWHKWLCISVYRIVDLFSRSMECRRHTQAIFLSEIPQQGILGTV